MLRAVIIALAVVAVSGGLWLWYLFSFLGSPERKLVEARIIFRTPSSTAAPYEAWKSAEDLWVTLAKLHVNSEAFVEIDASGATRYGVWLKSEPTPLPRPLASMSREVVGARYELVSGVLARGHIAWLSALPVARHVFAKIRGQHQLPPEAIRVIDDGQVLLFFQAAPGA